MIVSPLSTVDNTRGYARVSHSRQWSNYNVSNRPNHALTVITKVANKTKSKSKVRCNWHDV